MSNKIALITCYHDPDYIRARTLRAALRAQPDVTLIDIKNSRKGPLRYVEVLWQVWRVRRSQRPDAYLLTFRGQELLPFIRFLTRGTPLWFDEFVPPTYALTEPYRRSVKKIVRKVIVRLAQPLYLAAMRRCEYILADTPAHAEFSARRSRINLSKYIALPVGADETIFSPKKTSKAQPFQVFYYSTDMQPLHGVPIVLEAAAMMQNDPVRFVLVGGKRAMKKAVASAVKQGAHIDYSSWVPLNQLAKLMRESEVSLGGPFGGTRQADHVVTGKTYQSLACGVVTVVGKNNATETNFVDRTNCLKVRQDDATALAAVLRWAIAERDALPAIAAAGRNLYEREYSTSALARQLRPLLDTLQVSADS